LGIKMVLINTKKEVKRVKKRIIVSVFTIVVAAAVIAGGTMAWFTDKTEPTETVFTAGTVTIEAGRKIDINDSNSYEKYGTFFPDKVIFWKQGKDINGTPVLSGRSEPDVVLDNSDEFCSLGFDGELIVKFEHGIYEPEIVIVTEVTTDSSYPPESADVYVSATGEEDDWKRVGTANNGSKPEYTINELNILGVPYVKYVMIKDVTEKEQYNPRPSGNPPDGFDVKSIQVKGYYTEEDNWNPGDCNTRIFTIENTGTKGIYLRGKLTGNWYQLDGEEWVEWLDGGENIVTISLADKDDTDWEEEDGYFYYMKSIPGTYSEQDPENRTVELKVKVCLAKETGNDYQGKRYIVNATFEAIQSSNNAPYLAEGWELEEDFYKTNDE